MQQDLALKIASHPIYLELKRSRSTLGWWLTAAMMVVYYGFILLVAFDKSFLATPIGDNVTTLGMPIGLAVIVFTVLITGIYVRRANRVFDSLSEQLNREVLK